MTRISQVGQNSSSLRVGNQTAFSAADMLAPFHYAVANVRAYAEALLPLLARTAGSGLKLAIENTVKTTPGDLRLAHSRAVAAPAVPFE